LEANIVRRELGQPILALLQTIHGGLASASAVQAEPVRLVKSAGAVAIAKGMAATGSALAIMKGTLKAMLWAKTKTAVIIASAIILAGGGITIAVRAALGSQAAASVEIEPALQGTWVGQEIGRPQGECRLTVSGNSIKFQGVRAEEWYEATITLKPKAIPKRAAVLIERCPAPQYVNKTANFIYKIEGKTLTLAGSEPGSEKEPIAFEPNPDNPVRTFVFSKR
jgi:uncharacterized protein (TIGR03067 family)